MENLVRLNKKMPAMLLVALVLTVACGRQKDYVLVVDTSGSMDGQGRKLQAVKDALPGLLEKVAEGDQITVMNFDSKVHGSSTIPINSQADKQTVIDQIRALKATGAYTEMPVMVTALREKIKELSGNSRRTPVVMLMTDGIDDPARPRGKLNMEQFRDPEAQSPDPYIYYLNLGKLKDPNLEKQLQALSRRVTTVDKSKAGAGAGQEGLELGAIAEEAESTIWKDRLLTIGLPILGGLLLLALLFWLVRKFMNRNKLVGELKYYEAEINFPNKNTFRLDKLKKSSLVIGPRLGVDLRIKQLGIPKEFKFKSRVKKARTYLKPVGRSASMVEFRKQTEKGLVADGDSFKIGNFVFEYKDGKET